MKNILFYLFCILIHVNLTAQTKIDSTDKVATAYMNAYSNWDFDKMLTYYSDDIHFEDPTGSETFGQSFIFDGKENVYNFFKGIFKEKFKDDKPPYVNFIIEKKFTSGSIAIINSTFECVLPTSWFKENSEETVFVSFPFLTILHIEKGLIKKHTDYGDYSKYMEQVNAQIKIKNN